jgi:hypothetical protein
VLICSNCDTYDSYGIKLTRNYIECREWGDPKDLKNRTSITIFRIKSTELTNRSRSVVNKILIQPIDSSFCYTSFNSGKVFFPNRLYFNKKNEGYTWLKGCDSVFGSNKENLESIGSLDIQRWYVLENVIQDVRFIVYLDELGESHVYKYDTNGGPW